MRTFADSIAEAHRAAMGRMLDDAKYDSDAREEILDEIIAKNGTPEEQMKELKKDFIKKPAESIQRRNKEYGDRRRKSDAASLNPNGDPQVEPSTTASELPPDAQILEELKAAGWTDADARNYLLGQIKDKTKTPEEQMARYKKYTRTDPSPATEDLNKRFAREWKKAHPAGVDPNGDPSNPETLPKDLDILKKLEEAGWKDSDARKYLFDRIKRKASDGTTNRLDKTVAEQLADYNKYTAPNAGTAANDKRYGDKWRKDHPTSKLSPEEQLIDDRLKKHGYSPDARKKMLSELSDPKNKDKREDMVTDWESKSPEEVKAMYEQKENEQAAIDVAKDARKKGVVDPNANPVTDLNAKTPKGTPPTGPKAGGGDSEPWLTGPQMMLLGLLLIPIFLVLSRGMTTPSGQSDLRMPTMPTMPALRGPWSSPPIMAGGIPVSTGLPELASKRKTKSRKMSSSTPRMAVSHEKGGAGGSVPAININNVNAQGRDIPIDINSGSGGSGGILGAVVEEVVVTTEETSSEETVILETAEQVVVEEDVVVDEEAPIITVVEEEEPISIEFQGPSDPNRLFWMAVCLIVISIPLLLDYSSDWPERNLSESEYLSAAYHWIVLGVATFFLFLRLDRAYHWTTRYGRPLVRVTRRLPSLITPAIVGTVEGTERLIWGVGEYLSRIEYG
jgi:hypothetical protein